MTMKVNECLMEAIGANRTRGMEGQLEVELQFNSGLFRLARARFLLSIVAWIFIAPLFKVRACFLLQGWTFESFVSP